ncbi:MAG: helix-turn-helix transcriptional regulator [Oscillospiraceae bacterium]|nr:helix-turn-helix transcriptional regulator [Oscillospiraceae bacterium]
MRVKKEINIQIGEQIKSAREHARLTQEQMAERIEVSPQFVSDLERGVVGISLTTLKRVCVVLGVSSDQILFGQARKDCADAIAERCRNLSGRQFTILLEIIDRYVEAIENR